MKKKLAFFIAWAVFLTNTVYALSGVTSTTITGFTEDSQPENIFRVLGNSQTFTLIGEDEGKYFVVANSDYGIKAFSESGSQVFNPEESGNIAYWLNNEFISPDYTGKKLPQEIIDYIDYEHTWQTEPIYEGSENSVVCGVSLLSQTEFLENKSIIGIKDNMNEDAKTSDEYNFWWTRSPDFSASGKSLSIGFLGNVWSENPKNLRMVRPAFYLDKAFFENVKLDTAFMGAEIKKVLNSLDIKNAGYTYLDEEFIADEVNDFVNVAIKESWSDSVYDKNYVIDKKISFEITFENISSRKRKAYIYWKIGDNEKNPRTVEVDAKATVTVVEALPVNQDGRYDISLFISFEGKNYTEYNYDLHYVCSTGVKSTTKGFNIGLLTGNATGEMLELLEACGVGTVRASGYWNEIETSKGKYRWTNVDAHMKKTKAYGVDTLYVLGLYNTKLYKSLDENGNIAVMGSEEEIEAFVNYAVETAKRYPEITKYEIWNEPNANNFWIESPNVENYKKLVKAVSKALKAINPDIEIIVGVTSNSSENTPTDSGYWCINWKEFIASLMEEDLSEFFDGVSIHTYYTNRTRADKKTDIQDIVDIVRQGGGFKKIYMTETGGYSGPEWYNKTEDEKAQEIVRQFVIGDEYQLDGTWVYEFVNSGIDATYSEHNYGVITSENADFRPMEAYYATKNYLSWIEDAVYLGKFKLDENITGHVYSKDEKPFVIAWSNTTESFDYTFPYEVSQYDLYGKFVTTGETVTIGGAPAYLYGVSKSYLMSVAKEFITGHIEALATDYEAEDFNKTAQAMLNCETIDDAYSVMSEIKTLASEILESGTLSEDEAKAFLYDIARVYNRLSNYLTMIPDAEKASYEDVKKAYEVYKSTIEDLDYSEDKGCENIYASGLSELKNLTYDAEKVYNVEQSDSGYTLDKSGNLTVNGEGAPGEVVSIKITDPVGKLLYLGSETVDVSGSFGFNYILDGSFGEYTVEVGKSGAVESYSVVYEKDENYISFLQKKYYGVILKNDMLLNLLRDFLFQYSELKDGKNLLVDVAWDVNATGAKAQFTIKNSGDEIDGQIFLAGYDAEGRLTVASNVVWPIKTTNKGEYSLEVNFSEKPEKLKAFLWNEHTIQPLMKDREF